MAKRFILIIVVVALIAGFAGGFYYRDYQSPISVVQSLINKDAGQPDTVDFALFWNVWEILHNKYVDNDKLITQELIYGAINGMVNAVGDPYTVFLKPKESEEFKQQINGSFGGIGIEIGLRKNILTVITPIKDTPAAKAGLLAGDKIIAVDKKSTEGMKVDEAVGLIRGPKGTQVTLTIVRDGANDPKDYSMTRDTIKIPAVEWKMLDEDVAYIEMFVFNKNVDDEFKKASEEIVKSSAKKIILDVRNNPGGLLDSAVNIASYFLE